MQVWVVEEGNYSDRQTIGVFTSAGGAKAAAEAWCKKREAYDKEMGWGEEGSHLIAWRPVRGGFYTDSEYRATFSVEPFTLDVAKEPVL